MKKLPLLVAAGAGYVLGARAGRERYDEIAATARKVMRDPRVQSAKDRTVETVTDQAATAAGATKEKVTDLASSAADTVRRETSINPAP